MELASCQPSRIRILRWLLDFWKVCAPLVYVVIVETESGGTRERTGGEVKGKKANGGGSQHSCRVSDTVYPALLPLKHILRLLAAD